MVQRMLTSDQHQGDRPRQAWEAGDLEPGVTEMQATLHLYVDFPRSPSGVGHGYTDQRRLDDAIVHLRWGRVA
jgi:hypothetical protein